MNDKSVRGLIDEYRQKVLNTPDLSLAESSQMMVELSALLGNINDVIGTLHKAYIDVYVKLIEEDKMTASKAKILIMATPESQQLEEAKAYKDVAIEMIRALKYRCKSLSEEFMHSGNL
jgi:hypothetical protein